MVCKGPILTKQPVSPQNEEEGHTDLVFLKAYSVFTGTIVCVVIYVYYAFFKLFFDRS